MAILRAASVGATKRLRAVRWGVAGNIVTAWVLTLPAAGLVAALTFLVNGAPDLALTQFAVESLVVVLLTAALLVRKCAQGKTARQRSMVVESSA